MAKNTRQAPTAMRERFSRERWLDEALKVLTREGEGKLRIEAVSKALGVTKGSFYWHFTGRSEFLKAILEHWSENYNLTVPRRAEAHGGSAQDRLRVVYELVISEDLDRYDTAFDAWAAHEPQVAGRIKAVYKVRYDYIRSLFREMGFRGIDLEIRTTAFLSLVKVESKVLGKRRGLRSARRITAELAFFTRPLK